MFSADLFAPATRPDPPVRIRRAVPGAPVGQPGRVAPARRPDREEPGWFDEPPRAGRPGPPPVSGQPLPRPRAEQAAPVQVAASPVDPATPPAQPAARRPSPVPRAEPTRPLPPVRQPRPSPHADTTSLPGVAAAVPATGEHTTALPRVGSLPDGAPVRDEPTAHVPLPGGVPSPDDGRTAAVPHVAPGTPPHPAAPWSADAGTTTAVPHVVSTPDPSTTVVPHVPDLPGEPCTAPPAPEATPAGGTDPAPGTERVATPRPSPRPRATADSGSALPTVGSTAGVGEPPGRVAEPLGRHLLVPSPHPRSGAAGGDPAASTAQVPTVVPASGAAPDAGTATRRAEHGGEPATVVELIQAVERTRATERSRAAPSPDAAPPAATLEQAHAEPPAGPPPPHTTPPPADPPPDDPTRRGRPASPPPGRSGRDRTPLGPTGRAALIAAVLVVPLAPLALGVGDHHDAPPPASVPVMRGGTVPVAANAKVVPPTTSAARPVAAPSGLSVPSIGLDVGAPEQLGLDGAGQLAAPVDFDRIGWYAQGPKPGEAGPAVIVGHVDSFRGPAVFFRLDEIQPGQQIVVPRSDGRRTTFTVDAVRTFSKDAFPSEQVYGPTANAQLRLITCGGTFDRSAGSYEDNVVVFASVH